MKTNLVKQINLILLCTIIISKITYAQPNSWAQDQSLTSAYSGAVGFSIGNYGYIGTGNFSNDLWRFDPTDLSNGRNSHGNPKGKWTQMASMGTKTVTPPGRSNAVGFSSGNKGYIGTGWTGSSALRDLWQYDPLTNSWVHESSLPGSASARFDAVGFGIGTKGYIGTGTPGFGHLNDFWEYNPLADTSHGQPWTKKDSVPDSNSPGSGRSGAVGFSIGTKGYIGGGEDDACCNFTLTDFKEYDPSTGKWRSRSSVLNFCCGNGLGRATGFSIGSKGYVGTGDQAGNKLKLFYEYDPVSNAWDTLADFGGGTRDEAISFSIGGIGYMGTGRAGDNNSTPQSDLWEYTPALNQITTNAISSPVCEGISFNISFAAIGVANVGNVFTAQLSNSTGSFASPTNIGTLTSTTSGTIVANIHSNVPAGTGYRIRVVSSNPSAIGSDNGANITVLNGCAGIPTLSEWGLIALAGLLLLAGAGFVRKTI